MRTIFEHIENIKGKPHHIRKQVAFGTATVATSLIALIWLGSSLATGAFAIQGSSFAESVGQGDVIATGSGDELGQNVAGASAAVTKDSSGPARIMITNVATSSAVKQSEQTTIPF